MTHENRATVLVVDDSKSNIDFMVDVLDPHFDVAVALSGEDALTWVQQDVPDLILLDIVMPGIDGFEVCRRIKHHAKVADVPVIFSTGMTDEAHIEKAYEVGGVDFVTKPIKPLELLARVRTHLELRRLIRHLEYVSTHEKMTGLLNRGRFFELAQLQWHDWNQTLHAAIIDIDHFKKINDSCGHHVGDQVIIGIAEILKAQLDGHAICGRIGGEEFAVLWSSSSELQVRQDVESILQTIRNRSWGDRQGQAIQCTASAGVTVRTPSTANLDTLLIEADDALYRAKREGRDRCVFFSTAIEQDTKTHPVLADGKASPNSTVRVRPLASPPFDSNPKFDTDNAV